MYLSRFSVITENFEVEFICVSCTFSCCTASIKIKKNEKTAFTPFTLHTDFCVPAKFGAMCVMEIASSLHQMGIDYLYVRILVQ